MKPCIHGLVALAVILSTGAQTLADTWCSAHRWMGGIFCDDFDRYCTAPPPSPGACPTDATIDNAALEAVWADTSPDGWPMTVAGDPQTPSSEPFVGKVRNDGNRPGSGYLGQNTVDLTAYLWPGYTTVNPSDWSPVVLQFEMSGGSGSSFHLPYDTGYIELALDDTQAPMDYVLVGADAGSGCMDCDHLCASPQTSVHVAWPTVCQQYDPRTAAPNCPPLDSNVRAALAIGANAMLDNNPCHCENPADQVPRNNHLSFFDGLKWRILKAGQFPGSGDFVLGEQYNTVQLTIGASTVSIRHTAVIGGSSVESIAAGVPRRYLGGFNQLRGGTGVACRLRSDVSECLTSRASIRMGGWTCDTHDWQDNKSRWVLFDNVVLAATDCDGWGACCMPDGTCLQTWGWECWELGGNWAGFCTSCAQTVCCPTPFADADHDGDVDQSDFGAFQVCYTGTGGGIPAGCECFNRVSSTPESINVADFTAVRNCFTGPNVPWSEALTPNCVP